MDSENKKRIAKNTLFLYGYMLVNMVVSLFTSRLILNTLGIEDFGIYNVVGGVVAMIGFLNASMSGATSRFITFELGRGDIRKVQEVFSCALTIHFMVALVFFLVAETIGLWFLIHKLVIPETRMIAAHVVYQLSVLSTILSITQVPYNACITAHEKMSIYTLVEMLNTVLRLLVVYILLIGDFDKLILYAILQFAVCILVRSIYRWYCLKYYTESHYLFIWKKEILKPMLSFSGWDLYGNLSVAARQYGVNVLLNMFIGPIVNTASGIATTVNSVIFSFVTNIIAAFRPQIIKKYSLGDKKSMFELMNLSARISLCFIFIISTPLIVEMPSVLRLWLGIVPEYAINFCRILLFTSYFTTITFVLNIGITASGRIFAISFVSGTLIWLVLPVIYLLLRTGASPECAYIGNAIVSLLVVGVNSVVVKYVIDFPIVTFYIKHISKSLFVGGVGFLLSILINRGMEEGLLRLLAVCVCSGLSSIILGYWLVLDTSMKLYIKRKILNIC